MDEAKPLFMQIAEQVEDSIINGSLPELSRAPSTNELASFYSINPATAAKGVNLLVAKNVIEKKRGIGMFVTEGARDLLIIERRSMFSDRFIAPLLAEAATLGLDAEDLAALIAERAKASSLPDLAPPAST